jgi:hypothetical protein
MGLDPYLLLELLVPRGWNGVLPNFHHFRELDLVVRLEGWQQTEFFFVNS